LLREAVQYGTNFSVKYCVSSIIQQPLFYGIQKNKYIKTQLHIQHELQSKIYSALFFPFFPGRVIFMLLHEGKTEECYGNKWEEHL